MITGTRNMQSNIILSIFVLTLIPACYGDDSNLPFNCGFDNDVEVAGCSIKTELNDGWRVTFTDTPSGGTGPPSGMGGAGGFIYAEASYECRYCGYDQPGDAARFTLPAMVTSGSISCALVKFNYYMYGSAVGTLNVYTRQGSDQTNAVERFTVTGNQGEQWIETSFTTSMDTNTLVVFEAIRGTNFQSDMAIDSFSVTDCITDTTPSPTPPPELVYCQCNGDPHCQMFNSEVDMLIRGSCKHTLSTNRCPFSAEGTYNLIATFEHAKPTTDRSFVKEMLLEFTLPNGDQAEAIFEQGPVIAVTNKNSGAILPITGTMSNQAGFDGVSATSETGPDGTVMTLTTPEGIEVAWDGVKMVRVGVPSTYSDTVCGICGTMSDEMIIGPHDNTHLDDTIGCAPKAASLAVGTITTDAQEMADSWYVPGDDTSTDCQAECGQV